MFRKTYKKLALVAILALTVQVSAKDYTTNVVKSLNTNNVYVGLQSSYPAHGLSVKMDLDSKISVQGILGFLGTVNSYTVRGIYKFKKEQFYNLYGFGSLGMMTWDGTGTYADETIFGIGGGGGLEYDLRGIDRTFIPLYLNFELNFNLTDFDNYNMSVAGLGLGLHYKF
jgi:hypothetical protein